jgi:[ribosomal protein S18]-alanine N-acetyltransferase
VAKKSLTQPDAYIVDIRPRLPEHLPHLYRIELASFQGDPWPEEDFLKYDCLVAVIRLPGDTSNPTVAGFVISHELYSPADPHLVEREILNIAADPQFRRHGVGRALMAAELGRGGTHFLEVRESNLAARRLYEMQGFETIGGRDAYYNNPREAAIVMRHSPTPPEP